MYRDKYIVSVIVDGHPVKETGPIHSREVVIPFDSEYKIRLKNKHNKSCTAKVFIDGRLVSVWGDVIVGANSSMDLERFIDKSLAEGKRFKFVSLDHPDVDDPTSGDNGIIKVEFRLAKERAINININPSPPFVPRPWIPWNSWTPVLPPNSPTWYYYTDNVTSARDTSPEVTYTANAGPESECMSSSIYCSSGASKNFVSEAGATVEGGHSNQSFHLSNLEVEDYSTIIQLKMVGVKNQRPSSLSRSTYKYCSECGAKVERGTKFCSECGKRL